MRECTGLFNNKMMVDYITLDGLDRSTTVIPVRHCL